MEVVRLLAARGWPAQAADCVHTLLCALCMGWPWPV